MTSKDEIKDRVLTENTAQGILNHLREHESNRARTQRRWIWELLQNARDAAVDDDTHLVASVEFGDGEIVFQHNGRGFTMEEVAHLIYHGSTKLEDERKIGQYGSGFLTTHLLSPDIDVSGHLDDGRPFNFRLTREIGSAKELSDSMDRAWDEFYASNEGGIGSAKELGDSMDRAGNELEASTVPAADSFTTSYRYPVTEESVGAVEEGIETLKQCAPFVVVFNRQFQRISVQAPEETTTFKVVERVPLEDELQSVKVGVSEDGSLREQRYLLAVGALASVAIPMAQADNGATCLPLAGIPKLFLGFPLVGTETFSFPSVINSFEFTPTEHRDGVFLGRGNDLANHTNQAVVEEACDLHVKLLKFVAESRWANIHKLAEIPPISEQTWLSRDWLHNLLGQLVSQVRQTPAVISGDAALPPEDSILPVAGEAVRTSALWDLLGGVRAFRQKLPARTEADGWCDAVRSWAAITDLAPTSFGEGYNGCKLVSFLEDATNDDGTSFGTLERLEDVLEDDVDAVEWLDQLYGFLQDDGFDNLIRESRIILDQAGFLDVISNLHRDSNISEELKAIGDDVLDMRIREELRDTRLSSLADEIGKGDQTNKDVVEKIIEKLKKLCDEGDLGDKFTQASPRLLAWLVANEQWNHLTGFPAFSTRPDDGSSEVLWLGQKGGEDVEVPLAPAKAWSDSLQQYADLFPWRYIMAEEFFAVIPEADVWQLLSTQGYVRTDVVVNVNRLHGDFLPDELSEDVAHETVNAVGLTDLIFLTGDRGVMARVRDSQARARLFWRFLTEWLITRDPEGLELRTASCECGEIHRYYPATWLVPVFRNSWVPQGNDVRVRATAQSLARLLRGSGWTPRALTDNSTALKLLEAIRVTRFDLMRHFVVSDEESRSALDDTMTNILVSTGGDLSHVRDFVEDMKTDKGLPQHLADRREQRRVVHENQRLGGLVEDLVKEGLKSEGFTVTRTGTGSDFEIRHDMVEGDEEIGIELSKDGRKWLIEVKATREQRVRMTASQAKKAVEKGNGFLLCVVPVRHSGTQLDEDDVRANMRFVQDIGPRVEPLCKELDTLNEMRDDATTSSDSDIQLEIESGTARIRVENAVWQSGIPLADLSAQL